MPQQAGGKPVHSDIDRKSIGTSGKDPPLASVPNRQEEDKLNNIGEMGVGIDSRIGNVSLLRSNKNSDHRSGWLLNHFTLSKI